MGHAGDGDGRGTGGPLAGEVALRAVTVGTLLATLGAVHAAVNAKLLRQPPAGNRSMAALASVLVPARDEAATIGPCLDALRDQGALEILVLDDRSSDATADLAARHGARVLTGTVPPVGWLGKPHACAQLAAAASGAVLVFLDADVRVEPGAIGAAVALLDATGLDLVSPHPRELAVTWPERLVQPLLQWSILTLLPLRLAERSPRASLGAANGQFLVVRRDAYERAGGHRPGAVLDDLALLRAIKRAGGTGGVVDGTPLASCRMYRSWPELRAGYGKSLWAAFGSPARSVAVLATLAVAYLVPPAAAIRGSRLGALGYLAAVTGRWITARRTGGRAADAWMHPLSVAMFGYLTVRSHVDHARGRLAWKGRPIT